MSLNRGPYDTRPYTRCTVCARLALCYEGPPIETVKTARGAFTRHQMWCRTCMTFIVGVALRLAEP